MSTSKSSSLKKESGVKLKSPARAQEAKSKKPKQAGSREALYPGLEEKRTSVVSENEFRSFVNGGITQMPYAVFLKKAQDLPIQNDEWAEILDSTTRTLQRKKEKNEQFNRLQSERIIEIELFIQRGMDVFGNKDKFITWLSTPNHALSGKAPKQLLVSGFGIDLLLDQLGRIEHGIFL